MVFKLYFMCIDIKVSDPLELELQTVMSHHAGNRTMILWKSSWFS